MSEWQDIVEAVVAGALKKFAGAGLRPEDLAVTGMELGGEPRTAGHYRGEVAFYPASVIKLFYLAAAHRWLEDGRVADTPELQRALRDMMVNSSNEATGYVVDVLTETTSGPELMPEELARWREKRTAVTRYYHSLGYSEVEASFKTWNDGPYGRDQQAAGLFTPARNQLTTPVTARLLVEMAEGRCVSVERSQHMLALMKRDLASQAGRDPQAREFIGRGLPANAKLWSKAGDTSQARHDAAMVELATGRRFVLVIFTTRPDVREVIPELARQIVNQL